MTAKHNAATLIVALALLLCALALLPGRAQAQVQNAITVVASDGVLNVRKASGARLRVEAGGRLEQGDIVEVEAAGSATLQFADGAQVSLRGGTRLRIDLHRYDPDKPAQDRLHASLLAGGLRVVTGAIGKRGDTDAFRLEAPAGTIGIRGTRFTAILCGIDDCLRRGAEGLPASIVLRENAVFVEVDEGAVSFANEGGVIELSAGQWGYASDRGALMQRFVVGDGTRFPSWLWPREGSTQGATDVTLEQVHAFYQEFIDAYGRGDQRALLQFLAPGWRGSDGSSVRDVENYLSNSFRVFDRIQYRITGFSVEAADGGRLRVSYSVRIVGENQRQRLRHEESSEVVEELGLVDGSLRILRSLSGSQWLR